MRAIFSLAFCRMHHMVGFFQHFIHRRGRTNIGNNAEAEGYFPFFLLERFL